MSFVSHLEGAIDGARLPPDRLASVHKDRPILVRYDLDAVGKAVSRDALRDRPADMWRCLELLPIDGRQQDVSLGESATPLVACPRLGRLLGAENLWIKDESRLPTGSFKSRGLAMAIAMAKRFGVKRVALPSAGNAGGAAAAYAARAGIEAFVFMPQDTPVVNQYEARLAGARTFLVNGLINDCGAIVRQGKEAMGWFDLSTLKEPYRIEGKKTMGLELAEQLGWRLPDVILYPTGGGTGLIGMWKAFVELAALGWIDPNKKPRMVAVQSSGCAPIVRAFDAGERFAPLFEGAHTIASGLRVPAAVGDFLILDAVRESGGRAIAVPEEAILDDMRLAAGETGLPICPEAAACVGALRALCQQGWIGPQEQVVLFNTGAAQKYVEALRIDLPRIDIRQPVDWRQLQAP